VILLNSVTSGFEAFPLSADLQAAIKAAGYRTPTPIQTQTIATTLAGRDVIGTAQTGTGKTAAFLIPVVERLRATTGAAQHSSALILAPTRELAEQIHHWALRLGCGLRTALIVGGVSYEPQRAALRGRPAIIVATPGRLVDHLERGTVSLRDVRIVVLDEADRMLDMGFKPQLDRIIRALPPLPAAPRQTLMFSATLHPDLTRLARTHLRDAVRIDVGRPAVPPSQATQDVYLVEGPHKTGLLLSLAQRHSGTILVFARTKHRTDRVARALRNAGHAVQRLHADRSQSQRRQALEGFRSGRYRILIATDIAARGIDVADIQHVVNYDLPHTVEDYVHRVGRTARAGATGHATSFAAPEECAQLQAIERHIGRPLPRRPHSTRDYVTETGPGHAEEGTPADSHDSHSRPAILRFAGGNPWGERQPPRDGVPAHRHHGALGRPQARRARMRDVRPGKPRHAQ
jgi:ATP-dependent RNA helicase RhlE